jgi:hypothetical protein
LHAGTDKISAKEYLKKKIIHKKEDFKNADIT